MFDMKKDQRRKIQFSSGYFLITILVIWLLQTFLLRPLLMQTSEVPYSKFRQALREKRIAEVFLSERKIAYTLKSDGEGAGQSKRAPLYTVIPIGDPLRDSNLVQSLLDSGSAFRYKDTSPGPIAIVLSWFLPFLPFAIIWYFLYRKFWQQGGPGAMSLGKSKAKEIHGELTGIKYENVGGVDEATQELKEIIDFLKTPDAFTKIGAKLPKGVLLVGPPGTGKTLLAKATAGEAGVPFFSISGSDFVEMFVGVGASRVRDMFAQAKQKAPCIIFIDEIDAIGQARAGVARMGTNDEREQTLNQLLAEMDGFEANQGVIIMAATNRPEILDPALLRPGRFDRQVQITLPAEDGRRKILDIHTKDVKLEADVNLNRLAQITSGFSGADLANIVNEAALLAVRRKSEAVTMADFDLAIERVVAGLQRKMPLKEEVKRKVAYHEGGHALVAELLPDTDPVHKVSIIPTAKGTLGFTMQMPEEDQYLIGMENLKHRMAVLLGGRVAEMIVFHEPTTGASNDVERATQIARRMVTEFGMTKALGPVRYLTNAGTGYLGYQAELRQEISPETRTEIDKEIRCLVESAQTQASELLTAHDKALHEIARVLIEREVISGEEIARITQECV